MKDIDCLCVSIMSGFIPSTNNLLDRAKNRSLALDGGVGTALNQLGVKENDVWNAPSLLSDPYIRESVKSVHLSFLQCGVDILSANTYSFDVSVTYADYKLKDLSSVKTHQELVSENLELANEAIDQFMADESTKMNNNLRPLLAMPIASFASTITARCSTANRELKDEVDHHRCEGYGFTASDIRSYFEGRLNDDVLRFAGKSGVATLAFETVGDLLEVEIICDILSEKADLLEEVGLGTWIALTCGTSETVDTGGSIAACVEKMAKCPQVTCVGVNCTEPHLITPILETIKRVLSDCDAENKLIVVYPNSGETYISRELKEGETDHWKMTSACKDWNLANAALEWIESGANIIGGCCRINAVSIAQLVENIKKHNRECQSNYSS